MPEPLHRAKEKRAEVRKLAERMREIIDDPQGEDGALSAEQEEEFDRLDEQQRRLDAEITVIEEAAERAEERRSRVREIEEGLERERPTSPGARPSTREIDEGKEERADEPTHEERYAQAFDFYLRFGERQMNSEWRDVLMQGRSEVDLRGVNLPDEFRDMGVAQDTTGGFMVPEGFFEQIISATKDFGGMRRSRAFVLETTSGNDLPIPTDDDTSNTGAILTENTVETTQDVTLGQVVLHAYTYSSKIVKVSRQLLQDSAFDVQGFLERKLAERLGRITNKHFTTGDSSSKPQGVVTGAATGKTASGSTDFTVDELIDLKHAVDPSYRNSPEWMFNDTTLRDLKKKKDGEGRPLWQSGIAMGEPNTIDGNPYVVNQDMPGLTSGNSPVAYGDFSLYYIRDVLGIQILRLDERYADALQVGFLAFSRHDGVLVDAGQNPVQVLTLA